MDPSKIYVTKKSKKNYHQQDHNNKVQFFYRIYTKNI